MLICLLEINDLMCVCDFYLSLYQTMSQRFKKMSIVKIIWWMNWLTRKKAWRSFIDCHFRKLTCWLTFRTRRSIIESFRWHEDALCKFFIQLTKTSCFVITFRRISHFDDFLLTRVSLQAMKTLFLLVSFTSNWRFSLIIRVFLRAYLTILFNYSRISTSNSQKQDLIG